MRLAERRSLALLLVVSASCAGTQPPPAPKPLPIDTDMGRDPIIRPIVSVAMIIRDNHVTQVANDVTLGAAARALDAEAKADSAPSSNPYHAIRDAVARVRSARPELDDAHLIAVAARAMAASLHDSSRYVAPDEDALPPPKELASVGLVLRRREGSQLIVRTIPDSPAALAAVPVGLELRAVDHRPTAGVALEDIVPLLRGPADSDVTLTLGKEGGPGRDVVLRRAVFDAGVVDCRILDGKILNLGVPTLRPGLRERVVSFATAPGAPGDRVILDLRGNTGGLLDSAAALADVFVESGVLVAVEVFGKRDEKHATRGTTPLEHAHVAVLVNRETGSGAEAVAAALQDNGRGRVIGTHTASQASIDAFFDVQGGGKLKLAIARLLRANGKPIDGRGVEPDIVTDGKTAPTARHVSDVSCPGVVSATPVADDPDVARAVSLLLSQ